MFLRNESEINILPDERKLRESVANRLALKELPKEVLQTEMK